MSGKPQRGGRGREEMQRQGRGGFRVAGEVGRGCRGWEVGGKPPERSGEIRRGPGPGGRGAKPGSPDAPPAKV